MQSTKQILAWISLTALAINLSLLGITNYLYTNHNNTFTKVFCENQEKPELHCNGKCALKKIEKSNTSTEQTTYRIIPISVEYISSDFNHSITFPHSNTAAHSTFIQEELSLLFSDITPPPPEV